MKNADKIKIIKDNVDISDVLRHYNIKVNSKGWGFCCFHRDKKMPSMKVDFDTNRVCCFGCHANYDVFDFVQHYNNLENFYQTFKVFEKEFGIDLGNKCSKEKKDKYKEEWELKQLKREKEKRKKQALDLFKKETNKVIIEKINLYQQLYNATKDCKNGSRPSIFAVKEIERLDYIYNIINSLQTSVFQDSLFYGIYETDSVKLLREIYKNPNII